MKIRLTDRATKQARTVDAWLRAHHGDGERFTDELARAIDRLLASPELGAVYQPKAAFGVRRVLLPESQHYLYYAHNRERRTIRVLAVWSCYRGRGPALGELKRRAGVRR